MNTFSNRLLERGGNMSMAQTEVDWNPRISPKAFVASIWLLFAIAVSSTLLRSFLRYRASVPFAIDDILLFVAIVTLGGTTGVLSKSHDLFYLQVAATIGALPVPPDFGDKMRIFVRCQQAASMLVWATIYLVKLSFMVFFYRLVSKVRKLEMWWRVVFAAILVAGLISIPLGWIVCTNTGPEMFKYCSVRSMGLKEEIYLKATTSLDIVTDCLVISVPVLTLWEVRITTIQKLAIGSILSLSSFMIVIALIRISMHRTSIKGRPSRPDTIWLFFWQLVEAATAILMVSLTAFRSLYGQSRTKTAKGSKGSNEGRGYGRMVDPIRSDSKSMVGEERSDPTSVHKGKTIAITHDIEVIPLRDHAV